MITRSSARWITREPGHPYFADDHGRPWTPIGHNDAVTWPELAGLFRRQDLAGVERHLRSLKAQGITCLRLMLEYCQNDHRYIERPAGVFAPNMIRLWDDLFAMLEDVGLHVLLTPYDTFFMWTRWHRHPYNRDNGGPSTSRGSWLTCPDTRKAIRNRLGYASDRWGGSPALFAWDLFNEINPAHGGGDANALAPFVDDLSAWLRAREIARYGRAHLQTISIFDPDMLLHPETMNVIYRHPQLDFATTHFYEKGTIDDPKNTVAPALAAGRILRRSLENIQDRRPFLDTEHGPIHRFKDRKHTLSEEFDDECFRHFQWAHLAGGGAGGGMRWPNRHPHVLTAGMRRAQTALERFLPLITWEKFVRRNLNLEVQTSNNDLALFACGDERQAIVWLLGKKVGPGGMVLAQPQVANVKVPGLRPGSYAISYFDTKRGEVLENRSLTINNVYAELTVIVSADLAIAIRMKN